MSPRIVFSPQEGDVCPTSQPTLLPPCCWHIRPCFLLFFLIYEIKIIKKSLKERQQRHAYRSQTLPESEEGNVRDWQSSSQSGYKRLRFKGNLMTFF